MHSLRGCGSKVMMLEVVIVIYVWLVIFSYFHDSNQNSCFLAYYFVWFICWFTLLSRDCLTSHFVCWKLFIVASVAVYTVWHVVVQFHFRKSVMLGIVIMNWVMSNECLIRIFILWIFPSPTSTAPLSHTCIYMYHYYHGYSSKALLNTSSHEGATRRTSLNGSKRLHFRPCNTVNVKCDIL